MEPLLDAIVSHVPPPRADTAAPFSMCVAMVERDQYLGKFVTGRVASGTIKVGDRLHVLHQGDAAGSITTDITVSKLMKQSGMERVYIEEAVAGDIVSVAGAEPARIADTIAAPSVVVPLDPGPIDPPTLSMVRTHPT